MFRKSETCETASPAGSAFLILKEGSQIKILQVILNRAGNSGVVAPHIIRLGLVRAWEGHGRGWGVAAVVLAQQFAAGWENRLGPQTAELC